MNNKNNRGRRWPQDFLLLSFIGGRQTGLLRGDLIVWPQRTTGERDSDCGNGVIYACTQHRWSNNYSSTRRCGRGGGGVCDWGRFIKWFLLLQLLHCVLTSQSAISPTVWFWQSNRVMLCLWVSDGIMRQICFFFQMVYPTVSTWSWGCVEST